MVENRFHVSAQLLPQLENGLLSTGKHVIVYQTDIFQDLVCNESQNHIAEIAGSGAAVVWVLSLEVSWILSPMAYGQTTALSFYRQQTDGFVLLQTLGLSALFYLGIIFL